MDNLRQKWLWYMTHFSQKTSTVIVQRSEKGAKKVGVYFMGEKMLKEKNWTVSKNN